jgi:hypothetical protein
MDLVTGLALIGILLVAGCAGVVWLVSLYETRLTQLEAQLAAPCPICHGKVGVADEEAC